MDFREVVGRKMLKALQSELLSVGGRKFLNLRQTQHPSLFTNLTSLIHL
jgi:UV DNA damage repair endonuclease